MKLLSPRLFSLIAIVTAVLTCAGAIQAKATTKQDQIYSKKEIRQAMERVFAWQVANPVETNLRNNNQWARAAFYAGIMAAYKITGDRKYLDQAVRWATDRQWKLGERPRHADDQAPGQTYLELYLLHKDPIRIQTTRATLDAMIADPKPGREDWWWCDALFMSPPVLASLYKTTGDQKYLKFLNAMWWDTTDFLFDPTENLYYRDKNYIGKPNANGKKVFWARGNGWVMAGTVRVLQYLPKNDPMRNRYIDLLRKMAAAVSKVQGADGLWRPSLLDPTQAPVPETSSSGFFCYAITWGINQGYLDRKTYTPVVKKAWAGLNGAVHPDGKLGWVQPIGAAPASVNFDMNQEYGSGAFLFAGSEMYRMHSRL
ncbi:MAG TPA: glycoside hydrolase family 88 protein [Pyrinomonadaceae bacterium]|jgi:Predicted unsaturated glucuronyl hydrolase involved in regulation of bacterial surface properties, and related proteins|nr:glycoside hydrolase family 88 protein [Pyrinomonadaceae bacterium]